MSFVNVIKTVHSKSILRDKSTCLLSVYPKYLDKQAIFLDKSAVVCVFMKVMTDINRLHGYL